MMMLQNKKAVIYGGGGSLGGAVAKGFALAGAHVFLTGRNSDSLNEVADTIRRSGGKVDVAQVDGFDEKEIDHHITQMVRQVGKLDISFNAIAVDVIQNVPLVELSLDDFVKPLTLTMHTNFLTAKSAGKVMSTQGSGVILSLTATPGGIGYPYTGGFAPTCRAIECLSSNLAGELGAYGVRVVNIRSAGSPDSNVFRKAIESSPDLMAGVLHKMKADTMLKQLPSMVDIANTAVFLASDMAGKITGVTIDVTAGTTAGLNYRASESDHPRHALDLAS